MEEKCVPYKEVGYVFLLFMFQRNSLICYTVDYFLLISRHLRLIVNKSYQELFKIVANDDDEFSALT